MKLKSRENHRFLLAKQLLKILLKATLEKVRLILNSTKWVSGLQDIAKVRDHVFELS